MNNLRFAALAVALWGLTSPALAEVKVVVERNTGAAATNSFTFRNVPAPAKEDKATGARVILSQGMVDPNSGALGTLVDGRTPQFEDEPKLNFFFHGGTLGGCFRIDLGQPVEIAQVNSYSWHPQKRGPQVYKLYTSASDVAKPKLTAGPGGSGGPVAAGWKLIASVDTRAHQSTSGGQYGVSISDPLGTLGTFRHLLFCCEVTMLDDTSANTFYSEIDVIAKK